jgi:antitoxin (DNA-binding transcriptional repressor) of toxin-antitoxin stability system
MKRGHVRPVKVKTAQLKNHLSRYLHQVRKRGETIIVCDRDQPIASLSPLAAGEAEDPRRLKEAAELRQRFEQVGLTCRPPTSLTARLPKTEPVPAPDGRTDRSTVEEMRRASGW